MVERAGESNPVYMRDWRPRADGFVAHLDPALGKQLLNVTEAEGEPRSRLAPADDDGRGFLRPPNQIVTCH